MPAESAPRDHVVSVRMTAAEFKHLTNLAWVKGCDRSSAIRQLVADAPLRHVVEAGVSPAPAVTGDLSDVLRQRLAEARRKARE